MPDTSSNAHTDLIAPKLLGDVMQDAWGEICDDTGCHPLDIKRMGRNVFYDGGHWTALIALRLNERLAADALQALHVTASERPVCWIDILREWFGGERYARDYEYLDKNYAEQARRVEAYLNSRTALTEDKGE